jgi:hypothetical protein
MTPAISGSKQTASNFRCTELACVSYALFLESITVSAVLSDDGSGSQADGCVGRLHGWWGRCIGHCG